MNDEIKIPPPMAFRDAFEAMAVAAGDNAALERLRAADEVPLPCLHEVIAWHPGLEKEPAEDYYACRDCGQRMSVTVEVRKGS